MNIDHTIYHTLQLDGYGLVYVSLDSIAATDDEREVLLDRWRTFNLSCERSDQEALKRWYEQAGVLIP